MEVDSGQTRIPKSEARWRLWGIRDARGNSGLLIYASGESGDHRRTITADVRSVALIAPKSKKRATRNCQGFCLMSNALFPHLSSPPFSFGETSVMDPPVKVEPMALPCLQSLLPSPG